MISFEQYELTTICDIIDNSFLDKYFKNRYKLKEYEHTLIKEEDLIELLHRCNIVLEDHTKAKELLPTTSTCYSNTLKYNNVYFDSVKHAKRLVEILLKKIKSKPMYIKFFNL